MDAEDLKLSPLYQKIMETKRNLEKQGLDEGEAEEEAWEKRKHALKVFMRDNKSGWKNGFSQKKMKMMKMNKWHVKQRK